MIQQYRQGGELQPARYRRHRFARKYTPADVELLAAVDEAHETLSGPATRKILEREYQQYQQSLVSCKMSLNEEFVSHTR